MNRSGSHTNSRVGTVPDHWRRYKVKRGIAVSQWISNLAQRLAQLEEITKVTSYDSYNVWLGGLFFPEAYVTATRQAVAHHNSWSLETLVLRLDVQQDPSRDAFSVQGSSESEPDHTGVLIYAP
jgi:dynein heavy chain 1